MGLSRSAKDMEWSGGPKKYAISASNNLCAQTKKGGLEAQKHLSQSPSPEPSQTQPEPSHPYLEMLISTLYLVELIHAAKAHRDAPHNPTFLTRSRSVQQQRIRAQSTPMRWHSSGQHQDNDHNEYLGMRAITTIGEKTVKRRIPRPITRPNTQKRHLATTPPFKFKS